MLTLLTRPGCHLCDTARDVVNGVAAEFEAAGRAMPVHERSIADDPALLERYGEEIPVVLIDGQVHTVWHVDAARLRAALLETPRAQ